MQVIITVLIDTYNYGRYIGRAIESVLAQTYPAERVEILVVDDGSTDGTEEVVRRYGDRVRYLWKENGGQASALNLGLREAKGDLICLLDADDHFYPEKLSRVADLAAARPNIGLIYTLFDIVDNAGSPLRRGMPDRTWFGTAIRPSAVPGQLRSLIRLGDPWTCPTSAITVRRSAVNGLEIPESVFPHSPDLFLGLVLPFRTEVAAIERPLAGYVYHGDNVGLFRSSAANRQLFGRQMAFAGRYLKDHCGAEPLHYFGRGLYEDGEEVPGLGARARLRRFREERRAIARAKVVPAARRRSQRKLWLSFLLPGEAYTTLQRLPAAHRRWRGRSLQRVLAGARQAGPGGP